MDKKAKHSSTVKFIFFLILCALTAKILFGLFAHSFIESIYEGKAGFFNRIIKSQSVFPIEYYYRMADTFFYIALSITICSLVALKMKLLKAFLISLMISIMLLEGIIAVMLKYPVLSKFGLEKIIRKLYIEKTRNIVQLDHGVYDPELTYTLQNGVFYFSNPEFNNRYYVNKSGFRDDEDSLIKPEIIVLGDSYAMGWGVDQEDMYSQVIKRESGRKVLNTAVSSYGTVREMRVLNRIDLSNFKWLIIHYCSNDYEENKPFCKGTFEINSEKAYNNIISEYLKNKRYYPGKYIIDVIKGTAERDDSPVSPENEAEYFLNVITSSGKYLNKIRIIVIAEDECAHGFAAKLKEAIRAGAYPEYIKGMSIINVPAIIDDKCRFILDDHINARGHKKIAEEVLKILNGYNNRRQANEGPDNNI